MSRDKTQMLYYRIKEDIKHQINRGDLKPGDKTPSEAEICNQYGVSRISAKRALDELMWEGYVKRVGGVGTIVTFSPIDHLLTGFYSLSDEIRKRNMSPTSKLLDFGEYPVNEVVVSDDLKSKLLLYDYDRVYFIRRLRYADDEIIALDNTYIPVKFCPSLIADDFANPKASLYHIMDSRFHCRPDRAQEYFFATLVSREDANELQVSPSSPALRVLRISYSSGCPVEYNWRIYRGEKYNYRVDLQQR